ncbi:MAG TPA: LecA/PA-IL family lectin [Pyrinomonadaceae bacterium]|nr:LecA/PA-IL family lectin [Pyrinomonadaceae bacterium]
MKKFVFALLITLAAFSLVAADTITLRGGTTLRGNVLGFINGRFAVQLTAPATLPARPTDTRNQTGTTRTVSAGEVIFLRPRDIERIEIEGRSLDDARYQTRTVDVALGPNWVDTGVDVRRGQRLRVDATGTIYAGRTRITPAGLSTTDPSAPLPRAAEGELIGVIGNDFDAPIIEIGADREFTADRDGRLYLTVNRGNYTDARGTFVARVRQEVDLAALARADDSRNPNDNNYDPFALGDTSSSPAATRSRQRGDGPRSGRDRRSTGPLERTINVPATDSRGVDTTIELRTGDQVTITASGNVTAGQRVGIVSPDGSRAGASSIFGVNRRPLPNAGVGALIGYILQSNGQMSPPFLIGSQMTFTASVDGRLYLLVNDDNYGDNSGTFSARIIYPDNR